MIEHLDHIQRLGATALYLNPIFQSASNHRYHTFDYFTVDPLLGGDAALRELLDACHARGMRVVLDGVFNHASRGFWAFHHILENGLASPYLDWFFIDREALDAGPDAGLPARARRARHAAITGADVRARIARALRVPRVVGPAGAAQAQRGEPGGPRAPPQAAEHWIRFGADGWRLDVPREMPDDFWREFRRRVKAVDPNAYIVAEIWHEAPEDLHGDMYDAQMHYMLGAAITSFVGAGRLDRRVLDQHFTIGPNRPRRGRADVRDAASARARPSTSRPSPASSSTCSTATTRRASSRWSAATRARSAWRRSSRRRCPGAPSIYYGDEIGMLGELDPLNRGAFPWDASGAVGP